jgi:ribosomal protein S18 acetylase RimI-like enzyme
VNRTQDIATVIRRAGSADLAALSDFFAGLSVRTRYRRFFAAITPTPAMLRLLSGSASNVDAVIAIRGGIIIGHAVAVDQDSPAGPPMTDIGVVIADAWQGLGVGSALTRTLIAAAQARGVTCIVMDVLHDNRQVLAMIARRWPDARTGPGGGFATVHVQLPQARPQPVAGPCASGLAPRRQPGRQLSRQASRQLSSAPA